MTPRVPQALASPRLRRGVLLVGIVVAAVWFAFLDSHSLVQRVQYYTEHRALTSENAQLQSEIDALQRDIDAGLSDEIVEQVAREQYGMRRPGETVYPIQPSPAGD